LKFGIDKITETLDNVWASVENLFPDSSIGTSESGRTAGLTAELLGKEVLKS
jgi:hypothetical protein